MALDFHKNLTEPELHDVKGFSTASNGQAAWKNERGVWGFETQNLLPSALNIVDNTVAPPTEVDGDIYIIDDTGASHVDWDGAAANSWVRYNGDDDLWNEIPAFEGAFCYIKDASQDQYFDFNGTVWAVAGGGGGGGLAIGDAVGSSTANSVLFVDGSNQLAEDTDFIFNGVVMANTPSIAGAASLQCALHGQLTVSSGTITARHTSNLANTVIAAGATVSGVIGSATETSAGINILNYAGTAAATELYGNHNGVFNSGTPGTISVAAGSISRVNAQVAGTITNGVGIWGVVETEDAGATITTADGGFFDVINTAGTITNAYGVRIAAITGGTNNWAINTAGGKVELTDSLKSIVFDTSGTQFKNAVNTATSQSAVDYVLQSSTNTDRIYGQTAAEIVTNTDGSEDGRIAWKVMVGGTLTEVASIDQAGIFRATEKRFSMPHPTKEGLILEHVALEGDEKGVYTRGKTSGIIPIPDYWDGLVDPKTITCSLTAIDMPQDLFYEVDWDAKVIRIANCWRASYVLYAERAGDKLKVEHG